jgi:glycosyltransferase involved in cell wall biosynthesis
MQKLSSKLMTKRLLMREDAIFYVNNSSLKTVRIVEEGYQVEPGNVQDLRAKIAEMLLNESIRKEMGKKARELAKKRYSRGTIDKQLEMVVPNRV